MTRRQRRAQQNGTSSTAGTNNSHSKEINSVADIPYSLPPSQSSITNKPAKTLFEIAEERRAELERQAAAKRGGGGDGKPLDLSGKNVVNVKIKPDGSIEREKDDEEEEEGKNEPLSPIWDTLFLASSLSAAHFTLSVLTMHQYAEALVFPPLIRATLFTAFPFLTFMIHLFNGHLFPASIRRRFSPSPSPSASSAAAASSSAGAVSDDDNTEPVSLLYALRQTILFIVANISGCYLIHLCNDRGYYAVMKHAPNVGTLWVYAVIELGLVGAVLGVLGPAAWARWKGYELI